MKGMSIIVKTITRWLKGFIFLFGIYIILFGHITPGGGFAGGIILASSYILLTLAFGKDVSLKRLSKLVASELDSLGALAFLFVALFGMWFGGTFFLNFIQKTNPGEPFRFLSSGIIPICNIAIGIKVGASLFMVFIILSVLRVVVRKEDSKLEMVGDKKRHPIKKNK
ncbi:MnhB domain-containing protein [Candidatus Omnitrophota bacterium]